jgi:hypothetical protein
MKKCKKWHKGKATFRGRSNNGSGILLLPFFYLKTEKMQIEINLQDRVDELIELVLIAENQLIDGDDSDEILITIHQIYEVLKAYEF